MQVERYTTHGSGGTKLNPDGGFAQPLQDVRLKEQRLSDSWINPPRGSPVEAFGALLKHDISFHCYADCESSEGFT